MTDKVYKNISDLSDDRAGQTLWIRGRLSTSRAVGKGIFLVLRQSLDTVQAGLKSSYPISESSLKCAVMSIEFRGLFLYCF